MLATVPEMSASMSQRLQAACVEQSRHEAGSRCNMFTFGATTSSKDAGMDGWLAPNETTLSWTTATAPFTEPRLRQSSVHFSDNSPTTSSWKMGSISVGHLPGVGDRWSGTPAPLGTPHTPGTGFSNDLTEDDDERYLCDLRTRGKRVQEALLTDSTAAGMSTPSQPLARRQDDARPSLSSETPLRTAAYFRLKELESMHPIPGCRTTGPSTRTQARTTQTPRSRLPARSCDAAQPETAHVLRHRRRPLARSVGLLSPEPDIPHSPLRRFSAESGVDENAGLAPLSNLRRRRRERRVSGRHEGVEVTSPAPVPPAGKVPSSRPGRILRVGGRGRGSVKPCSGKFQPRPPSPITPARAVHQQAGAEAFSEDGLSEISGRTRETQSPRNGETVWDAPLLTSKPCEDSWRLLRALTMHGRDSDGSSNDGDEEDAMFEATATAFLGRRPSSEVLEEAFGRNSDHEDDDASTDFIGASDRPDDDDASFLSGSTRSGADAVSGQENDDDEGDDDLEGDRRSAVSGPLSPRTMRKEHVFDAIRRNDTRAVMNRLIRGDAHVGDRDAESHTLLHVAAQEGLFRMVHMLARDFGAPLDETDISGNTALHLAGAQGHRRVSHFLKTMGADDSLRNGAGYTCDELRAEL